MWIERLMLRRHELVRAPYSGLAARCGGDDRRIGRRCRALGACVWAMTSVVWLLRRGDDEFSLLS